jgi:hypothetical protein
MTPTYRIEDSFSSDWGTLSASLKRRFRNAEARMFQDLKAGRALRPGLRVKRVEGTDEVWEMTFAPDGRATFEYGSEVRPGEPHIVWRRVGTHQILANP